MLLEQLEIVAIAGAVGKRHVQIRAHLRERIVALAVHGKGEHRIDPRKNRRGAVALVYVEIDYRGAIEEAVRPQS